MRRLCFYSAKLIKYLLKFQNYFLLIPISIYVLQHIYFCGFTNKRPLQRRERCKGRFVYFSREAGGLVEEADVVDPEG